MISFFDLDCPTMQSISIGDFVVCIHGMEKCPVCFVDHRSCNNILSGLKEFFEEFPAELSNQIDLDNRESLFVGHLIGKVNIGGIAYCYRHLAKNCETCFPTTEKVIDWLWRKVANANSRKWKSWR